MTWKDQVELFERELKALSAKPLCLDLRQFLRALGPDQYLDEAISASREFARMRLWPPLSDQARLEVCLSLECAMHYCEDAVLRRYNDEDLGGETEQEAIESLLVEYWQDVGRYEWLRRYYILTPDEREEDPS